MAANKQHDKKMTGATPTGVFKAALGPKGRKTLLERSPAPIKDDISAATGPVQFFSRLLEVWNISNLQSACMLLGYEKSGESDVRDILTGRAQLETRDEKDRIAELFVIRKVLLSVFRDRKVENQWLRERQEILGGASPLDLLLEGSWPNLLRVRQLAELMAGL
ncbi:MAG TPA: hypothetical protein VL380_00745 [Nitrosospira sp.]|nr:hypothetical protein [Nitrosospira sp.]